MEYKKYNHDELEHLHKVLRMILKDTIEVLDKHNIPYYMDGGSCIGTVRHKGFIPWDDDIDLNILRKDYDKAIKVLQEDLNSNKYEVCDMYNTENYYFSHAKIFLKGTYFSGTYTKDKIPEDLGLKENIFIDLFPLYNCPNNKVLALFKYYFLRLNFFILANYNFPVNLNSNLQDFICNVVHKCLQILPLSFKTWKRLYIYLLDGSKDKNAKKVTFYAFAPLFFEKTDFEPAIKGTFEGLEVRLPKNNDKILTELYGDYMQLPPKEERFNHAPDIIDFGDY